LPEEQMAYKEKMPPLEELQKEEENLRNDIIHVEENND